MKSGSRKQITGTRRVDEEGAISDNRSSREKTQPAPARHTHITRQKGMIVFQIFKRLSITLLAGMMLAPFGTAHAARSAVHSSQTASTIDPAALRIPDTTFAPAVLNPQADSVLTTATLDTGKFFTYFHPNGYAALGRVNGYYEAAGWTPTGSDPIIFRYLASIYPSSQAASTAFDA